MSKSVEESDEDFVSEEDYETTESEFSEEEMSVDGSIDDFQDIPEPIVYLKPDKSSSFKPDEQLFNILNNKINDANKIKNKKHKLLYERIKEMNKITTNIDNYVSESMNNSNENMFNNIIKFVLDSNNNNNKTSIEYLCELNEYLIPTAVICGENACNLLLHLENKLKTCINPCPLVFRFNEECINKINNITNQQKVIIIIDSIEQWTRKNLLTLLIYTLHNSNNKEFILIIGISTDQYLIQKMIEPNALKFLTRKYFFESLSNLSLKLTEEILIEKSPILFNEKILNELINHSKLNDFSINRFEDEIKYLLMSHFVDCDINKYIQNRKEINEIHNKYRNALNVFKMITDHLKFNWSKTQIIGKLQNKHLLYKYLLSKLGASDNKIKIQEEEKKKFPQRIDNFNECHKIYKILEQKTKLFDTEIAKNAAEQYTIVKNKLEEKKSNTLEKTTVNKKKKNAKQKRSAWKKDMTSKTNTKFYTEVRKKLFELLRNFIKKHLKSMNELEFNETFVYSNDNQFCNHILPPTNEKVRKIYENYKQYLEDFNISKSNIELEPMCCIYDIYKETDTLYINLHDAYGAFKQTFQIEDDEMSTDDSDDDEVDYDNVKISEKEKQNQIQFRMSIDDLIFCGFVKAASRKKQLLIKMADLF